MSAGRLCVTDARKRMESITKMVVDFFTKDSPTVELLVASIIKPVSSFQNLTKRRMNWEHGEKSSIDF